VLVPVLVIAEQFAEDLDFGIAPKDEGALVARKERIDTNLEGRFEVAVSLLRLETKLEAIRELCVEAAERMRGDEE
jgi:hypothetical protein